jgi:hypothetical protein
MARMVHRDRKASDRKVRRGHMVRKARGDRLCVPSFRIAGREALAEPLRFAYPDVRLEAAPRSLEIWKLLPRWIHWVRHSQVRDTDRALPVLPGCRPTHGFGPVPALVDMGGRRRYYHSGLHSDVFRRSSEGALHRCFEEVVRRNSAQAIRSAAFPGSEAFPRSDLAPQPVVDTSEEFPAGLSDAPPEKATDAEWLSADGESAKKSFSEEVPAARKLAAWAYCSDSPEYFRCRDASRFEEEENR